MKALPSILCGMICFQVLPGASLVHAATNYEGALELWINTSSDVVPFAMGCRLRARPGSEPFFSPTLAWNGGSMAFPGLIPSEPLLAQGVFISDATYTNDPDFGEFLAMAISPVPVEGLDDGATNATPEPMPIYAELASPFAVPCPSASASFSGRAMAGSSNPDPDCLECENNNCTEALREEMQEGDLERDQPVVELLVVHRDHRPAGGRVDHAQTRRIPVRRQFYHDECDT
jgi:hypothetical protein